MKLSNVDDGTKNAYVPFKRYLQTEVKKVCALAHAFETKLIRGFSFYHPRGTGAKPYVAQVVDQLGQIAETCHRSDLTFGVEVETNLVGSNGHLLAEIHRQVNHPALVMVFDAGNLIVQGYSGSEVLEQLEAMLPGLGWVHIKDYRHPKPVNLAAHVNEDVLANFVPADRGDACARDDSTAVALDPARVGRQAAPPRHPGRVFRPRAAPQGGRAIRRLQRPGRDGRGVRALCKVLDYVEIGYHLRDFEDIKAARGF